MTTLIPPITHPLGRAWDQPDRAEILVDDKHAVMSADTLKELAEYNTSIPSGVYEGKMWKRVQSSETLLCWFGPSPHPDKCSINFRPVLLLASLPLTPNSEGVNT
jgi:hypothetical protein